MSQFLADLLLLLVTLVWGTTFVIVRNAIREIGPLTFVGVRFFIGGTILLIWYLSKRSFSRKTLTTPGEVSPSRVPVKAVITGVVLSFAYITQTLGLLSVPAGKAAFITGLSVVIVPLASSLILGMKPGWAAGLGIIAATAGLFIMSVKPPFSLVGGDILVFLCAVGFAAHIILVGEFSPGIDPYYYAAVQLLTVALTSISLALFLERPFSVPRQSYWAILFTGVFATAGAFFIQSWVQRYTSATHTALIFSAEPVFGAIFAWYWAGESLSAREIFGAGLVLAGMLMSEIETFRQERVKDGERAHDAAE